jgi:hypothetical protein
MKLQFSPQILKHNQISNFILIHVVGVELFHGTDGRTDMTKLTVAFRNFTNVSATCKIKMTIK